jgi:hypothetical protein
VVIESIWGWNGQGSLLKRPLKGRRAKHNETYDDVQKHLAFHIKGDVFDDNGRGYNLVVRTLIRSGNAWGSVDEREGRRTPTRRKVRIIWRRQVRISDAVEPLLSRG